MAAKPARILASKARTIYKSKWATAMWVPIHDGKMLRMPWELASELTSYKMDREDLKRPKQGLWWKSMVYPQAHPTAIVRSTMGRRVARSFEELLWNKGYTKDGMWIRDRETDGDETMSLASNVDPAGTKPHPRDLKGTLRIIPGEKVMNAKIVDVVEALEPLFDKLVEAHSRSAVTARLRRHALAP